MKRKRLAVFYDLSKAFDKVWREGLLLKVLQAGVSGRMYKWIRCFLHDRSARVKVDGHPSDSVKMREGVPHEKDWNWKSALCPCWLEVQNTAHVLQSCPLHKRERESTWPTESSLGNKLHGTATDLRLTVRFIALTGLQI